MSLDPNADVDPRSTELRAPLQYSNRPRDREPPSPSHSSPSSSSPSSNTPAAPPPSWESIQQWHQARLERRLRGEYESASARLTELVASSSEQRARLVGVRVEGANGTSRAFLASVVQPYLSSPSPSTSPSPNTTSTSPPKETLTTLLHKSRAVSSSLLSTGVFKSVSPTLSASRHPFAEPGDFELVIKAREGGRVFLKTGTEVGEGGAGGVS